MLLTVVGTAEAGNPLNHEPLADSAMPLELPAAPVDADALGPVNYFTQGMISNTPVGMEIWRLCRLPSSDAETEATYIYFPVTICYGQSIAKYNASSSTRVKAAWLAWGNRCDLCSGGSPNMKPNAAGGPVFMTSDTRQARVRYTNYDRAEAATIAGFLYALGFPAHGSGCGLAWCGYLDVTAAVGIPDAHVITYGTAKASADAYFPDRPMIAKITYATVTDWVILPDALIGTGTGLWWGVLCDCEYSDKRLASRTTRLIKTLATIVHHKRYKFAVVANGLLGAGISGGFCGVGVVAANCDQTNLSTIVNSVDQFLVAVGQPVPKGYTFETIQQKYWDMLGAPGSFPAAKVAWQLQLGAYPRGTPVADALKAHAFAVAKGVGGLVVSPVFAKLGGAAIRCTNQRQQAFLFGKTTVPLGREC